METMELWDLDIQLQASRSFPEVGVEFSLTSSVHYKGTKISPPDSTVVFTWSREFKATSSSESRNLGSNENLGFCPIQDFTTQVQQPPPKFWTVVGSSRSYVPSSEDVGRHLRLVSYATNHMGVQMSSSVVVIFDSVRPLSPSPRCIIPTPSGLKRLGKPQSVVHGSFRILSYNLLADIYIKTGRDDYCQCPPENLTWEYRRQNLLTEILSYQADVLCLQEVQSDHFKNFFEPELVKFGYYSIYKGKTKKLYNGKEYITDGCATFFHRDKFNLVKNYEVEYEKMALPVINRLKSEHRQEGISRLMKENIATVVILEETKNCHSRICVANTHLHSGKGASDVRLFQVINLIRGLQKIDSLGIPVLVCGDMNSAPGSDTHTFLVNGKVGYFRQAKKDVLGISKYLKLKHSMNLANAYSGALDEHQNETLDYIFYSEHKLKVDGVLEFPHYESVGKKRLLPTPQWSSDHVALVANLRIKKAYRQQNNKLELPVDPWDELKKVDVNCNYLKIHQQQKFKKSKEKNFVMFDKKKGLLGMFDQKKGLLGSLSIQERLISESQHCSFNPPNQQVLTDITQHHIISCQ